MSTFTPVLGPYIGIDPVLSANITAWRNNGIGGGRGRAGQATVSR